MVQLAKEWGSLSAATRKEIRDLRANGFGNLKGTRRDAALRAALHHAGRLGGSDASTPTATISRTSSTLPPRAGRRFTRARSVHSATQRPSSPLRRTAAVANKFHVYFKDMLYYGYCVPENVEFAPVNGFPSGTASAWIVVENDFVGFPPNDVDVTGLEPVRVGALKVTQAHEFMHALQFNINVYQSGLADGVARDVGRGRRVRRDQRLALVHQQLLRFAPAPDLQPLRLRRRVLPELAERDLRRRRAAPDLDGREVDERGRRREVRGLRRKLGAVQRVRPRTQPTLQHQRLHHRHAIPDRAESGAPSPRHAQQLPGERDDSGRDQARPERCSLRAGLELSRVHSGLVVGAAHPHVRRRRWLRLARVSDRLRRGRADGRADDAQRRIRRLARRERLRNAGDSCAARGHHCRSRGRAGSLQLLRRRRRGDASPPSSVRCSSCSAQRPPPFWAGAVCVLVGPAGRAWSRVVGHACQAA